METSTSPLKTVEAAVELLQQIDPHAACAQPFGDPLGNFQIGLLFCHAIGADRARIIAPVPGDDADVGARRAGDGRPGCGQCRGHVLWIRQRR